MPRGYYKRTELHRNILSDSHKGHVLSDKTKRKIGMVNKGRKNTPETKKKMSQSQIKRFQENPMSNEQKRKLSIANKGKKYPNRKSSPHSEECKRKISEGNKGKHLKEKCPFWMGGISEKRYTSDWTKTLRRSIRERDQYICQICSREPSISVHHIDYNKLNCNPDNLITLCVSCHSKTNNNRNYWKKYFKRRLNQK
jgi:hypothetical protein